MNRELTAYFGTEDWYFRMESVPGLRNLKNSINMAKRQIANRDEIIDANEGHSRIIVGVLGKAI